MSREIKFRAWDTNYDLNRMEYFDLGDINSLNGTWGSMLKNHTLPIMQYTGLKDKNGKEIYEGDIVRYESEDGDVWTAQVLWDTGEENIFISGFRTNPLFDITTEIYDENGNPPLDWTGEAEVIGDIYENPKLLEV